MTQEGSIVKCIKGYSNILTEGEEYTVKCITKKGNYILYEVDVPSGFTSFDSTRFENTGNSIYSEVYISENFNIEELDEFWI